VKKNQIAAIIQAAVIAFLFMIAFEHFFGKKERQEVKEEKQKVLADISIPPSKRVGEVITVKSNLYNAKFSSVNGKLVSFKVKKYNAELVSGKSFLPFLTLSENGSLNEVLANLDMRASSRTLVVEGSPRNLVFTGTLPHGRIFKKVYTFYPNSYRIDLRQELKGEKLSILIPGIRVNEAHTSRMGHIGPVAELVKGNVKRFDAKSLKKLDFFNVRWVGQEDKYFIQAVKDSAFPVKIVRSENETVVMAFLNNCTLYSGPKEISQLSKLNMEKAIDFGIFAFLAKPFLKFFLFIHKFIPNYGLVIIVLTIIIKIILHPLTHKSYESMKKMQKLAPKLEELKKKYKDNPQKLNEEMMKLYKREGVNPMGGCLPMILQIPVFFALYEIFLNAVELKGSPFLWIADLSQADPTYVLPVLMGASMILQQKLTPSTNPQQEKIFLVMAVVFTFMFATFPAGLVLYWFTNNVITAIQNLIINKMILRKE